MSNTKHQYFPYIDGLRALAVLAVIIYHLNPSWLRGGFAGVDIFFVISGYVVTASLANRQKTKFFNFCTNFYSRRSLRILPALVVCLLATTLASILFIPEAWLSSTNKTTALYAFFGLSNYSLIINGNDYFSPKSDFNPYTHTWSLGVEEQFYLLFPILFYLLLQPQSDKKKNKLSSFILLILLSVSFVVGIYYRKDNQILAFYSLATRFWELGVGVLLFKLSNLELKREKVIFIHYISFLLILISIIFSSPNYFPVPGALPAVLGTAGLVWSFKNLKSDSFVRKFLENKFMVDIGKLSYSLYLWHWPVIVLFRWTVGINTPLKYTSAIALTVVLAIVSYFLIEKTIRYSRYLNELSKLKVVLVSLLFAVGASFLAESLFLNQPNLSLSITRSRDVWMPEWQRITDETSDCSFRHTEKPLTYGKKMIFNCEGRTSQSLFVMGDSHAEAYLPLFKRLSLDKGYEVVIYTGAGCPVFDLFRTFDKLPPHCRNFFEESTNDLKLLVKKGDILFLSSLRLNRFGDQWAPLIKSHRSLPTITGNIKEIENSLVETKKLIKTLSDVELRIVFEAPKPIFFSPPFRCSDWFNKHNPVCSKGLAIDKEYLLNYRSPIISSLNNLKEEYRNIHVWDPFEVLCPGKECSSFVDDKPLFFDGDHLSGFGNEFLYPNFSNYLESLN